MSRRKASEPRPLEEINSKQFQYAFAAFFPSDQMPQLKVCVFKCLLKPITNPQNCIDVKLKARQLILVLEKVTNSHNACKKTQNDLIMTCKVRRSNMKMRTAE